MTDSVSQEKAPDSGAFLHLMKSGALFLASLALTCLPTDNACADETTWSLGTGVSRASIQEFSISGDTLLTETGWEPYLELGLAKPLDKLSGNLSASVLLSSTSLDYDGQSQSGASVESRTDYRRTRIAIGYRDPLTETTDLVLSYVQEQTRRDIRGQGASVSLNEDYRQRQFTFGVAKTFRMNEQPASFEVSGVFLAQGSQQVWATGVIDKTTLPMKDASGVRVRLAIPLAKKSGQSVNWTLVPNVEYMHSSRSQNRPWRQNGQLRGTLSQPEMEILRIGLTIQAGW